MEILIEGLKVKKGNKNDLFFEIVFGHSFIMDGEDFVRRCRLLFLSNVFLLWQDVNIKKIKP